MVVTQYLIHTSHPLQGPSFDPRRSVGCQSSLVESQTLKGKGLEVVSSLSLSCYFFLVTFILSERVRGSLVG